MINQTVMESETRRKDEERFLEDFYGDFFSLSARNAFSLEDVPSALRPLAAYARFWGETDESDRERMLEAAPDDVRMDLKATVDKNADALDAWLTGVNSEGTTAARAYEALRMAAQVA